MILVLVEVVRSIRTAAVRTHKYVIQEKPSDRIG